MLNKIQLLSQKGLEELSIQKPETVKELSRVIQALCLWNKDYSKFLDILFLKKKDGFWDNILDTSRVSTALATCGIKYEAALKWLLKVQENRCWNNNEVDTSYALIALSDFEVKNEKGCEWLFENYGEKWEYPGTTALIITALYKQDKEKYKEFITDRINWLLSKRENGGWKHIATSNLVIQALILTKCEDIIPSIEWLLNKKWENSTALSLITLKMYLNSQSIYIVG